MTTATPYKYLDPEALSRLKNLSLAARQVVEGRADRGILVCGTGQGMAIAANKVPGVRAAVVSDTFSARMAMAHNDARILCVGARVVGVGVAFDLIDAWLLTEFEGGRHQRRVDLLNPAKDI